MEIIKCDRYKKILKPKRKEKSTEKTSGTIMVNNPHEWISFDLCKNCAPKLVKSVKRYLQKT